MRKRVNVARDWKNKRRKAKSLVTRLDFILGFCGLFSGSQVHASCDCSKIVYTTPSTVDKSVYLNQSVEVNIPQPQVADSNKDNPES